MTQKQHVQAFRKIKLSRALCDKAGKGALYIPFIGDGDLALEVYRTSPTLKHRMIYGADLDKARVQTATERLQQADIRVEDCDGWPFSGVNEPFSLADFDAYANPYKSFLSFWQSAEKLYPVVMFFTDAHRQTIFRQHRVFDFDSLTFDKLDSISDVRKAGNFWLKRHVIPWVTQVINPAKIVQTKFYLRQNMLYWGCVVSER